MNTFRSIEVCRTCGSTSLRPYLDLGATPLADAFVADPAAPEAAYPLEVCYCMECGLSQLSIVVDPRVMFSQYCYRSSISRPFREHCKGLVAACLERSGAVEGALAVDIASNDGCLLGCFRARGFRVVGVEPAVNLAALANADGIPTVNAFWNAAAAASIRREHGPAGVVTGTNVFAHVDDVHAFVEAVRMLLDDGGVFVLEFPHALELIRHVEYDTIYHEHLSYFLVKPLVRLFAAHRMAMVDVEQVPIHGGSLRCFVQKRDGAHPSVAPRVAALLEMEERSGCYDFTTYQRFAATVERARDGLRGFMEELRRAGKSVVGYGATAKGNTLLNYCRIGRAHLTCIVDDTPEKQNRFTPGQHIPVKSQAALAERPFDYMLILAWNYREEIMRKTAAFRQQGGRYIIPIPELTVV